MGKFRLSTLWIRYGRKRPVDILRRGNDSPWLTLTRKVQPLVYPLMKPTLYLLITAAALLLAIAVSSGKLGEISDMEARKRASQPFSR